jgi:alkylated DNA repair dioxygenase AlkB
MNLFSQNNLPFSFPDKSGYHYEYNEALNYFFIQIPNGELIYAPYFYNKAQSDKFLTYLLQNEDIKNWKSADWKSIKPDEVHWNNIQWQHDSIRMFGKLIPQPRYTAWYGDEGKSYQYSGLKMQPQSWNEGLLTLKKDIEKLSNQLFNSVLLNWYRDGLDHMSWHADNERELGTNPEIASINFGATRRFLFRRNENHAEKIEIPLHHGSLLIMRGEIQHFWQHALPKQQKTTDLRINLTFRLIQ